MFARTERLLLRPSWPEDATAIHDAINDENIVRNLARAPWPYDKQAAMEFAAQPQDICAPHFLLWKRTAGDPVLVGSCGLGRNEAGVLELGYWIARPYWGLGYATEAARAVIDIARMLGHSQIYAGHFADNPASGRVMRKLGFRATGTITKRHSRGRGHAVSCVDMQLDLDIVNFAPRTIESARMLYPDSELKAA